MNLRGLKGVDEGLSEAVAGYLASRIAATGRHTVITRDDVRSMLEHEQLKMDVGCEDQTSCLAELGGALGVEQMVSGTLSVMGPEVLVNLVLIDVAQSRVLRRESAQVALGELSVEQACLRAVDEILPRLLPGPPAPVRTSARVWPWVAAGTSVLALGAGAGLLWYGDSKLGEAQAMADSGEVLDYQTFDAAYTPGRIGWYGGLASVGVGLAAGAAALALFFLEAPAGVE
jgi:hypothetical protein